MHRHIRWFYGLKVLENVFLHHLQALFAKDNFLNEGRCCAVQIVAKLIVSL